MFLYVFVNRGLQCSTWWHTSLQPPLLVYFFCKSERLSRMCSCGKCAHWKRVHPHWQWRSKCVTTDQTQTLSRHVCTPGVWRCHKPCERSGDRGGICTGIENLSVTHIVSCILQSRFCGTLLCLRRGRLSSIDILPPPRGNTLHPLWGFRPGKTVMPPTFLIVAPVLGCLLTLVFWIDVYLWKTISLSFNLTPRTTNNVPNNLFRNSHVMAAIVTHIIKLLIAIAGYLRWLQTQNLFFKFTHFAGSLGVACCSTWLLWVKNYKWKQMIYLMTKSELVPDLKWVSHQCVTEAKIFCCLKPTSTY